MQVSYDTGAANSAPTISSNGGGTTALITVGENSTVVMTVTATDVDAGHTLGYSIAGGEDAARFTITNSTGQLTVANASLLNYESATSHTVTARVTNSGGLTYDETFTINVTDVNEAAPRITSNGGGATALTNIAENSTAVTRVTASDADTRQTLGYSIVGVADAAKFTISSSTGALSFVSASNYEAPTDSGGNNIYDVTVQVSDGNGGVDSQVISLTVTAVNDRPVIIANSGSVLGSKKWTPSTYDQRAGGVRWNEFDDNSIRRSSGSKRCSWSWSRSYRFRRQPGA